jgi:hypothetical protein
VFVLKLRQHTSPNISFTCSSISYADVSHAWASECSLEQQITVHFALSAYMHISKRLLFYRTGSKASKSQFIAVLIALARDFKDSYDKTKLMRDAILMVVSSKNRVASSANPTVHSGNPLRQTQHHQCTVFLCLTYNGIILYDNWDHSLPGPFRLS